MFNVSTQWDLWKVWKVWKVLHRGTKFYYSKDLLTLEGDCPTTQKFLAGTFPVVNSKNRKSSYYKLQTNLSQSQTPHTQTKNSD